jgi:antitoxin ParD1/3/4
MAFSEEKVGSLKIFLVETAHLTPVLPNFAKPRKLHCMSTMNISLPDQLKAFVDEQVSQRGYGTSSEYVRELIRKDQDRLHLRELLLAGAASPASEPVGDAYFERLRHQVRAVAGKARGQS